MMYCGLFIQLPVSDGSQEVQSKPVPLQAVDVKADVVDMVTSVTVTQTYENKETDQNIEAIYKFPVDARAAVHRFVAKIDGRTVVAKAMEKEQAAKQYDDAIKAGKTATLLEEQTADVFQCSVGNIGPGQRIHVEISYVAELDHDADHDSVRFVLPTSVAPRYTSGEMATGGKLLPGGPPVSSSVGYRLSFQLNCCMSGKIQGIQSPTHPIVVDLGAEKGSEAGVGLASDDVKLDKDLVVLIKAAGLDKPRVFVETHPDKHSKCAMLTLVPRFALQSVPTELIFLVDCSGSMQGVKMTKTRDCLKMFLRSLPEDCTFNVVCFGSTHVKWFPRSVPYSQANLDAALARADAMDANLGGTEIGKPLQDVLQQQNSADGRPITVLVLTDGEVWQVNEVFGIVREGVKAGKNRVFALGVGNDVSKELVQGMARIGKGLCQFITEDERMEKKVIGMLKNALLPPIINHKIRWVDDQDKLMSTTEADKEAPVPPSLNKPPISLYEDNPAEPPPKAAPKPLSTSAIWQAPYVVPTLMPGSRAVVYCMLQESDISASGIHISADSSNGPLEFTIPSDQIHPLQSIKIHTLAARALIRDLEEGTSMHHCTADGTMRAASEQPVEEQVKRAVVDMATQYGLASRYTSLIAVDEQNKGVLPGKTAQPRVVDQFATTAALKPVGGRGLGTGLFAAMRQKVRMPMRAQASVPMQAPGYGAFSLAAMPPPPPPCPASAPGGPPPCQPSMDRPAPACEITMFLPKEKARGADDAKKGGAVDRGQNQLQRLLSLQQFNGEFRCDQLLAEFVSPTAQIQSLLEMLGNEATAAGLQLDQAVLVTALAIAVLTVKFSDAQDEWELIGDKSRRWIQSKAGSTDATEKVVAMAVKIVQSA